MREPVFGQHDRGPAEAVRLDHVGAGLEEAPMQFADLLRARTHEIFVTSFEIRPAEVGRTEMHPLDRRAAGAVEEDDSLGQQFAQKFETVVQVSHSTIAGRNQSHRFRLYKRRSSRNLTTSAGAV